MSVCGMSSLDTISACFMVLGNKIWPSNQIAGVVILLLLIGLIVFIIISNRKKSVQREAIQNYRVVPVNYA